MRTVLGKLLGVERLWHMLFLLMLCFSAHSDEIADDRIDDDPCALTKKDLPLYPIKRGDVIIAAGLSFDCIPWTHGIFDPNKQEPDPVLGKDGKTSVDLEPTSRGYNVTDDIMIVCWDKQRRDLSGEPTLHGYRCISYRLNDSSAHLKSITILTYDNIPFCICFGNMPVESPALWSDARLQMQDGKVEIDIGQVESGTGAFNSHAYISVEPGGPKLTRMTSGGRGR